MTTFDTLATIVHEQFDIDADKLDPDAPFASYDIDSLTLVELLFAVEDRFGVTVPDSASGTVTTLGGLAELIDELTEAQAVGS